MIYVFVLLLKLFTLNLLAMLPLFKGYVQDRSQRDAKCQKSAEKFVALYAQIESDNYELEALRDSCAAMSAEFPVSTAALQASARIIVAKQTLEQAALESLKISLTKPSSSAMLENLIREPTGACALPGNLKLACEPRHLVRFRDKFSGFNVSCNSTYQVTWTYAQETPMEIL